MDFHTLPRRELQALCKRNKIPANLTNVALADSLKALEIVEGYDTVMQASKSELPQSSIGPRVRLEAPSPFVNVTPAPSGVTSRRRGGAKAYSAVTQVTGTRRSARLAEKSARLAKGVGSIYTGFLKKDLFTGDAQEFKINLEESLNSLDDMSGVTDMEENSDRKHEGQGDLAFEQDVSIVVKPVPIIEEEISNHTKTEKTTEKSVELLKEVCNENLNLLKKDLPSDICCPGVLNDITGVTCLVKNLEKHGEALIDSSDKQDMSVDGDLVPTIEYEFNNLSESDEAKSKLKEGCRMEINEQGDGNQSFVFAGVIASTAVEVNFEEVHDSEVDNVELVSKVLKESYSNDADVKSDIDVSHRNYDDNDTEIEKIADENTDEDSGSVGEEDDSMTAEVSYDDDETFGDENDDENTDSDETELNPDESDSFILERTGDSIKKVSFDCMPSETSLMSCEDDDIAVKQDVAVEGETETAPLSEEAVDEPKSTPTHQLALENIATPIIKEALPLIFSGSDDSSFIPQAAPSTPKTAGRTYSRRVRIATVSGNKENIGNGSKTAPAKERSKYFKEIAESLPLLDDQSLVKLSKNMKDLQITQKSDKYEGENEAARIPLKVLPANQKADTSD